MTKAQATSQQTLTLFDDIPAAGEAMPSSETRPSPRHGPEPEAQPCGHDRHEPSVKPDSQEHAAASHSRLVAPDRAEEAEGPEHPGLVRFASMLADLAASRVGLVAPEADVPVPDGPDDARAAP